MNTYKILIFVDRHERLQPLLTYGLPLAFKLNAQLWVQYAYDFPPELVGEVHVQKDTIEKYEKVVQDTLGYIKIAFDVPYKLPVKLVVGVGNRMHKINQLIDQEKINLLLTAKQNNGGELNPTFDDTLGELITSAHCPVLLIPEGMNFLPFRHVAFATDLKQTEAKIFNWLHNFIESFQAQTDIIYVSDHPKDAFNVKHLLDNSFVGLLHQSFHIHSRVIEESLEQHVLQHRNDLVVVIPRDHSFLVRLFQKSVSQQLAYQSKIPLLTIHEAHLN